MEVTRSSETSVDFQRIKWRISQKTEHILVIAVVAVVVLDSKTISEWALLLQLKLSYFILRMV
jgi:hypothetical protein